MAQPCNIAAFLPQMAARRPDALAIVMPAGKDAHGKRCYSHLTYRQLDAWSDDIARGLLAAGLQRGMRTVLMVRPSLEFFALTFALFKAGIAPVMVDPGLGRRQLRQCLDEAQPQAFIGIAVAHVARIVLGWARSATLLVTVGGPRLWGGLDLKAITERGRAAGQAPVLADTGPDDLAAILFTSGSTGPAKGVVYHHRHFVAQVELIRQTYAIEEGELDLPTFPLFALFDPALGMTTVVPQMDFSRPASVDPQMLAELIDDWGITNVFGSPALLDTVVRHAQRAEATQPVRWRSVRRVISAGAPVPAAVLEGMHTILPANAEIVTPYGATECLPVASIGSREVLAQTRAQTETGAGVCVGRVVAPNQVRIIAISDGPVPDWRDDLTLPQGEVGEITVLGPTTTTAYWGRDDATAKAKIPRPQGVVHRMGDVGYFDAEGRLWYCGRKGHRVELPGRTLHTAPVEEILNTHREVRRTALVPLLTAAGTVPLVWIERLPGGQLSESQLCDELRQLCLCHDALRDIERFAIHPRFPVDIRHNAKIGREALAAEAQRRFG